MRDWKHTLNLPRTDFPMKANLQTAEPQAIARWDAMNLYGRIRERRSGAPKFILHDGPPYANGRIHIGHALNKILKDFIVRARTMAGYDAPYVPGWDCHGLPIELKVDRELGPRKRQMSVADFRRACRAYADRYVGVQREDFKRLGVLGDWDAPYLTMKFEYQAVIVRALGTFVGQGMVYKGKKPVHWCLHCRTALAEAEVEYEQHSSPSIYVEFPLSPASAASLAARVPELADRSVSALIWTTTPWTIPSNLAIAFHPEIDYAAYSVNGVAVIVAEELADTVARKTGRHFGSPIARFKGKRVAPWPSGRHPDEISFRHPLYDRDSLAVAGEHVTLEQGTGVVHTAPGHGSDDFNMGVRYDLEIYAPIDHGGHFADTVPMFGGLRVFDANPKIEEALAARGRLWHRETLEHSYPHCWRCHNPVIFLATSQWFIAMDQGLRAQAVQATREVQWIPEWGEGRMNNMFEHRPDWCISRQRSWGVPIPAVDCTNCHEPILDTDLVERAAQVFERHGADAWYERAIEEFLPPGFTCPACGGASFTREQNILDVWFDSGSSHEAVLPSRSELRWPADLYLEGSDQYRGWFQSSLLIGVRLHGRAPYRAVLTHGFVVDEEGRKMSKSLGNVIAPQEIIAQSGAEILRLWVSMVDYREEMRLGKEVLARAVEAYRKIRNTCRYLLANLNDFDPSRDALPLSRLQEIDRYALAAYADAALRMLEGYACRPGVAPRYDFPAIFHEVNRLATVELSAFYLDVSKDRLYTLATRSLPRRSAQTAMYHIADGLTRLLAPILPVTADELWHFLPGQREASVHLADFPTQQDLEAMADGRLLGDWQRLMKVREFVNVLVEQLRQQKVVGTSLEAQVRIRTNGTTAPFLERYRDDLPTILIVSQVTIDADPRVPLARTDPALSGAHFLEPDGAALIEAGRASGVKCQRCWRYVPRISTEPDRDGLCDRCLDALAMPVS